MTAGETYCEVNYRAYAVFVSVLLVAFVLLTLQTRGQGEGIAANVISSVTAPIQTAVSRFQRGAFSLWSSYLDWKGIRRENQRLREEAEQLRVAQLQTREVLEENQRFRRLLKLSERLPLSTLSGEVIGREWGGWVRALTVNRGRGDGVKRLTPVIVPEGLVGRVVEVRAGASIIQLLNDPSSTVGAVVQRGRTSGVVEGDPSGGVRFKFLPREGGGVQAGDIVVTSGLGSGLFPKGVPLGRVVAVEARGSALFHYAILQPMVDFARVEEVLFLTSQTAEDLSPHFRLEG